MGEATSEQERYDRAWRSLRLSRGAMIALFALYLPVVGGIAMTFQVSALYLWLSWVVLMLVAAFSIWTFPCPRCDELFTHTWIFNNPFTMKCMHCGLRVGDLPIARPERISSRDAWRILRSPHESEQRDKSNTTE